MDNLPQTCPNEYLYTVRVFEKVILGNVVLDELEICQGDLEQIILFDFIENYDENGTWEGLSSLLLNPVTGVVNLQNANGGFILFNILFLAMVLALQILLRFQLL